MTIIRNEIGSEFWEVPVIKESNQLFPENTNWFVSGTSALYYIIEDITKHHQIKKVALPSWCCNCLITPFRDYGICVEFYPVIIDKYSRLRADYTATAGSDITIVMRYFGFNTMKTSGKPHGIIIEDCTHSLFLPRNEQADYYFGSLRKWAGFYTGGFAWAKKKEDVVQSFNEINCDYLAIRQSAMKHKMDYLEGVSDSKDYLIEFEKGEELLEGFRVMRGALEDEYRALHLDKAFMVERRRKNAKVLLERLNSFSLFKTMEVDDCPLFIPLVMERRIRDKLKKHLISHDIYCPVHWPLTDEHRLTNAEERLYNESISIICDQRYDVQDMKRICDEIESFFDKTLKEHDILN